MNTKTDKIPATITAAALAELANLSQRRIYQLAQEKRIPPAKNGRWPMAATIRKLFETYQSDPPTLQREKMLKTAAERRLREHELEVVEGQWLKKTDVFRSVDSIGKLLKVGLDNRLELRLRVVALERFNQKPATPPLTPEQLAFVVETFCDLGREANATIKTELKAALYAMGAKEPQVDRTPTHTL